MKKEFIPYEQALALKELGFDEPCFTYYGNISQALFGFKGNIEFRTNTLLDNSHGKNIVSSAPTFSQAFRWFREKCNLNFTIITNYAKVNSKMIKSYRVGIIVVKNNIIDSYFLRPENDKLSFIEFTTYEEAELECLKKLIEIVKTKHK